MASPSSHVRRISACTIKPTTTTPSPTPKRCYLTPWDLTQLTVNYIQYGLLFHGHHPFDRLAVDDVLDRLKTSLSAALLLFHPLAGRLVNENAYDDHGNPTGMYVSIDCNGQGASFIHAISNDIAVADVLKYASDVALTIKSLFPMDRAINYDGCSQPLLAVQLTELKDGYFLGCSINHAVADGTSYWHFISAWAEMAREGEDVRLLSRQLVLDRWFITGYESAPIKLPFVHPDEFIDRFTPPPLQERFFHIAASSVALLKGKANKELGTTSVSSFQSVASHVWRGVTRARGLPAGEKTSCKLSIEYRSRLRPPLSSDYFGNSTSKIAATTTAGELLSRGLGWGARLVHEAVASHADGAIRGELRAWMESRWVYKLSEYSNRCSVSMGGSPRFDAYGCDFGWGTPVAVRSGSANKFDGQITFYPGREGEGSMDLEICLLPECMKALEADAEFMSAVNKNMPLADF